MAVIGRTQRPADHEPGEQIENGRQIQLTALPITNSVASPTRADSGPGRKLPIEQIRRDGLAVIALVVQVNRFRGRAAARLLHQANHPLRLTRACCSRRSS